MHPDLVGQLDDGETLLAVEAKGRGGITRGLAQAQQYQEGFHLSILAADASVIGASVERFARRQHVGLIVAGLRRCPGQRASFDELARVCSELDYDRSSVLFFVPERIESITDRRGQIQWGKVGSEHFRSTTSYQYKSILGHAGVIEDTGLGGGKAPEEDIWALRR